MKFSRRSLRSSIHRFLKSNENYTQLKPPEQSFLLMALTEFVARGATKFIAGGIKHADSDFFTETNFIKEMDFEIIDQWMYHKGREFKLLMKSTPVKIKRKK